MQVFGGYGVVKEYDVERFLRDSLILPIYEGTSQIQALMATKDLLKAVMRKPADAARAGRTQPVAGQRPLFGGEHGRRLSARAALVQLGARLADGRPWPPARAAPRWPA